MVKSTVITIGRQYGSGGRDVGIELARREGIPYYDKELLVKAAKDSGLSEGVFEDFDEKPKRLLYAMAMDPYSFGYTSGPADQVGTDVEAAFDHAEAFEGSADKSAADRVSAVVYESVRSCFGCRNDESLFDVPDRDHLVAFFVICGALEHAEITYRRKVNNSVIWVRSWVEVVPDPRSGDVIAFVYTEDINEKHIRNGIMEHMLEHNYSDIVYVELVNKEAHHLKSGELITGKDKTGNFEEMVSLVTERCISPSEKAEVRRKFALDSLRKLLEDEAVISVQYRAYGNDADDDRMLECEAYYFDERKDIIVISQQDITENYKKAMTMNDELNKALEEARSADNAKNDFLSQMSRDLRSPINSILGMSASPLRSDSTALSDGYVRMLMAMSGYRLRKSEILSSRK